MNQEMLKGYTDMLILNFLNESDYYGYQLNQKIEELTNGEFKLTEATLYTTFRRLLQNEWITFYMRDGTNNVPRKYYKITDLGIQHLKKEILSYKKVTKIINSIIQEGKKDE